MPRAIRRGALVQFVGGRGADRQFPGQQGESVSEQVYGGGMTPDVDQHGHILHGARIVRLERVAKGQGFHVDGRGVEVRSPQECDPRLDDVALRRRQQHGHRGAIAVRLDDREIQFHVLHVEGAVLLRFPRHHGPGLRFIHPVDFYHLAEDLAPPDAAHHLPGLSVPPP